MNNEHEREEKIKDNIKNIDKFIKPLGKNKKDKVQKKSNEEKSQTIIHRANKQSVYEQELQEIHYGFKASLPLNNEKFSAWYTIDYSETRTVNPEIPINDQRAEIMDDVEAEVIGAFENLRKNIIEDKVWKTIL